MKAVRDMRSGESVGGQSKGKEENKSLSERHGGRNGRLSPRTGANDTYRICTSDLLPDIWPRNVPPTQFHSYNRHICINIRSRHWLWLHTFSLISYLPHHPGSLHRHLSVPVAAGSEVGEVLLVS